MRSMVPRVEKPRLSARRADSRSDSPYTPGTVLGSPIPMSNGASLSSVRMVFDRSPAWANEMLASARVARLGLLDTDDRPRVLPVTFALVGGAIYSAIDHKPKRPGGEPARLRYLRRRP